MEHFLKGRTLIQKNTERGETCPEETKEIPLDAPICKQPVDADKPKIEIISQENIVKRIVITCTCGQRIELDCHYNANQG